MGKKMAIFVAPGSEVLDIVVDKKGGIDKVFVVDESLPVATAFEIVEDTQRIADVEAIVASALAADAAAAGAEGEVL